MEVLTQVEFKLREQEMVDKIKKGVIFIYPTDTIYGIGCNASNDKAVKKMRFIKERNKQPFSVWVPSKDWIRKNCLIDKEVENKLKLLPGKYTLILKLKNKKAISKFVAPNSETLGVRIPEHWFGKIIEKLNVPIITTSANKTANPFMTKLENVDYDLEKEVEFMIYEGEKEGRPSKIINYVEGTVKER
ncbi:threonylcarbamoyl-AMP synthase [Candidatus Woesearchaeota archaeon]|nr:threonylcarbamoyl-AMP synthase [Candidatus Woesearchaeota archaeon]